MQSETEQTGSEIVKAAGLRLILGPHNRFYWQLRCVMLTREVAMGADPTSVVTAMHEVAHSRQPRWWFWFLWLKPFRWFVECNAWERVFGAV